MVNIKLNSPETFMANLYSICKKIDQEFDEVDELKHSTQLWELLSMVIVYWENYQRLIVDKKK